MSFWSQIPQSVLLGDAAHITCNSQSQRISSTATRNNQILKTIPYKYSRRNIFVHLEVDSIDQIIFFSQAYIIPLKNEAYLWASTSKLFKIER